MQHVKTRIAAVLVIFLAAGGLGALAPSAQAEPGTPGSPLVGPYCSAGSSIAGTGATFANNAHQVVFIPTYNQRCGKGSVSYSSTGSGAGKAAAINHTHAFGMSDEPLSFDEQLLGTADLGNNPTNPNPRGRVSPLHHIPLALGAVTVSYNLSTCGIGQEQLNLRSPQVAAMYTGLITRWNDPLLTAENPKLATCNKQIRPAARSDGSGTTYAFKDYLSKRNPLFNVYKANDLNTAWPAEDLGTNHILRGKGNSGVAAVVKSTDGAVGYVELSTAQGAGLTWAKVDGASGVFNSPSNGKAANCDLAALGATHPPSSLSPGWEAVSITDTPNPVAYAICTFTYALVYNNLRTAFGGSMSQAQAQTLVDYLAVGVDDAAQNKLPDAGYAKLPPNMQAIALAGLASIAYL